MLFHTINANTYLGKKTQKLHAKVKKKYVYICDIHVDDIFYLG